MGAPKISNPRVLIETATGGSAPTKVVCVIWELADEKQNIDGEWAVEWDDMYADLSEDVRSARSEQGGYFALQREGDRGGDAIASVGQTPEFLDDETTPVLKQLGDNGSSAPRYQQRIEDPPMTGPLSTARLLEFENGMNLPEVQDDLPAFFASRPVVQAPAQIFSDPSSVSKKTEVLFLLAPATMLPQSIKIYFTPTWTSPNTPPSLLAEMHLTSYESGEGLHTAWASKRLDDLQALQEIAKELEREGSRGTGQGRLKVGVEGGGMDEEAVRREGWMVGEEQVWVVERFLTFTSQAQSNDVMDPFAGLGISTGLSFGKGSSVTLQDPSLVEEEEEEDDLFAMPLSPRSPDMAMSPFSMFRGEALSGASKKPYPSKLRHVGNIDTSAGSESGFSTEVMPTQSGNDVTPTTTGAPPTPPRESR